MAVLQRTVARCAGLREAGMGSLAVRRRWGPWRLGLLGAGIVLLVLRPAAAQDAAETCSGAHVNQGAEVAALKNNTHQRTFEDLSGSVSLSWVGDGTGVILVLTTFQVPFLIMSFGQSRLYRSEDFGKTFTDITSLISNTFIRTEFGMAVGPENSGKVILTADISGARLNGRIFRSKTFARDFISTNLPFYPLTQILYHHSNSDYLLVLSTTYSLWISKNFGDQWEEIHKSVCLAKWGLDDTIFFTTSTNGSCKTDPGTLQLKRTKDFGKTFESIRTQVYSFGLGGRFLFASVMTEQGSTRRIHVSPDQGNTWTMAQLPAVGHEQFYSILAANDDMVFMHVDEEGDSGYGTIYTSDERGVLYSKSLERHLYTATGGDTDFTNVTSLRGVFVTSVLSEDNSIQSVITFDRGGEWTLLRKPEGSRCDSTAKNKDECSLHIHASYSISQKLNVPMPPLSEPKAVGIVIAHGSVGDAISVMSPDVYISDDGGYTWSKTLTGPHYYAILDSGGILVAIEQSMKPISVIKFSTDEGQCWSNYTFSTESIYFTGLATEPGAKAMIVSVWGYRESYFTRQWVSYTIDFKDLVTRPCADQDYMPWLAHSSDPEDPSDGCVLGYKERYLRLQKSAYCQNGRDYTVSTNPSACVCSLEDYLCDFGYFRAENQSQCVEQPELKGHDLEFCLFGQEELLITKGYRKIPGDQCSGGISPSREVKNLKGKCTSDLLQSQTSAPQSNSIPAILSVVAVLLVAVVAAVLIVKKYVCGGRFLVHRYSVLQQHAEANGIDPTDTGIVDVNKRTGYHDDSDEDLLE
ncbi:sortilin isoform X3 [Ambystoma mexicanum]|uniref:sortilin isoform X3 n=1 Tax=Ambystoma mexicanum TaxID=8296 RepID=UPI0037E7166A